MTDQASPPPLVLVDGSSYLFRAFHAIRQLSNSKGEPTNAIYGVINMIRKLMADYRPERMAVVFDAKGKTFRNELYPEYKAHRPPMPEELARQIEPIHRIIRAMGIPLLVVEGVEADDVIGTLCTQASERGIDTLVSTGDKDMAQLVDEHVTLIDTMKDTLMTPETVEEKFGIPPRLIVDYLALVGDVSDNIPGVPKCGPKTAVKWLREYGSLDGVIAHADEIKGKIGENLRASLDLLPLSRQLATIKRDVPLEVGPEDLQLGEPDVETLRQLFRTYEFKSWLAQLDDGETPKEAGGDYETILTEEALERWIEALEGAGLFALDTETTSLDYMQAEIVGLSFAIEPGRAAYLPLAHRYEGAPEQLDRKATLERLRPLLEGHHHKKVGQHIKYDMNVLANHGIALEGIAFDTMLESYVLDSTASRHDMDSLALAYLDRETTSYEAIAGKGARQRRFDEIEIEKAAPYAAEDADVTLQLHRTLWPKLEAQERLKQVFLEIELPLVPVLSRMERTGVLVDAAMLEEQSRELARRMEEIEQRAFEVAGEPFNLGSPKQIQQLLFEKQGLPVRRKTPKGQPSTAESVLQELADEGFELPQLILEHRALAKLKSTYTDKLPTQIDPRTGRVHTSYHQAVAATGRLSSSDPNLQNIPIRSEEGRRIRQAFVAPPGHRIVAADYSQIELRIMAHLSGDEGLLQAFREGRDIHTATAAEIFAIDPEQVNADQRRSAKAINFGLIYGMSAFGLARQLGIGREEAQAYVDRYFERYPGVKAFMDAMRAQAHERGYVETLFGRRLHLPEIESRNAQRRQYAERAAINAPMQGTAADIIKRAMIATDAWLRESGAGARMIMQVHDELVFEVEEGALDDCRREIERLMSGAAELAVPLVVEIGVGSNWDEAH